MVGAGKDLTPGGPVGAEADALCRNVALTDVSPCKGLTALGLVERGAIACDVLERALIGCGGGVLP